MPRAAECHPDREYVARGMCRPCYSSEWERAHPGRDHNSTPEAVARHAEYRLGYEARRRGQRHKDTVKRYGLTVDEHAAILAQQGGACAICRKPETKKRLGFVTALAIDHDHSCSVGACRDCVRGILCFRCNMMIGYAQENPMTLRLAANYLVLNGA